MGKKRRSANPTSDKLEQIEGGNMDEFNPAFAVLRNFPIAEEAEEQDPHSKVIMLNPRVRVVEQMTEELQDDSEEVEASPVIEWRSVNAAAHAMSNHTAEAPLRKFRPPLRNDGSMPSPQEYAELIACSNPVTLRASVQDLDGFYTRPVLARNGVSQAFREGVLG